MIYIYKSIKETIITGNPIKSSIILKTLEPNKLELKFPGYYR